MFETAKKKDRLKNLCCKTKPQVILKRAVQGAGVHTNGVNHKSILTLETMNCLELEPDSLTGIWRRLFPVLTWFFFNQQSVSSFKINNKCSSCCKNSESVASLWASLCYYSHIPPTPFAHFEVNSVKTTLICSDFGRAWFTGRNSYDKKGIWNPLKPCWHSWIQT